MKKLNSILADREDKTDELEDENKKELAGIQERMEKLKLLMQQME